MGELHHYGLVRFSRKTGKIDTSMTGLGKGLIQLWALQNTTKTKACIVVDLDTHTVVSEYEGSADGFPVVRKIPEEFCYDVPDGLWEALSDAQNG